MSDLIFDPERSWPAATSPPPHRLGQQSTNNFGEVFMFVKAKAAMSEGRMCRVASNFEAQHALASVGAKGDRVGMAAADIPLNGYGWVQRVGVVDLFVKANCGASRQLYTSATAGALDDTASSQEAINGVTLAAARGAGDGTAKAVLEYPVWGP